MDKTPEEKVTQEEAGRFSRFLSSLGIEERGAKVLIVIVIIIVLFSAYISFRVMPPFSFPENKMITVKKGASLTEVSALLEKENLIRSQSLFESCAKLVGGAKPVSAGQYLFKEPISACRIAIRIARSISGIPAVRVTIPEGMSNKEVAVVLEKNISNFDTVFFLEHARPQEGYLFPDTYFFPENVTALEAEQIMINNFNKKIEPWSGAIETSKHSLRDIIIMASILEREASNPEDMALVSGVLWNRISKGMPLQVDATFMYLLGKKSSELTTADLKIKSAYNTYTNKGLPAGPIGNPGIVAIRAAISPTATSFMYYLSDKEGAMHYAKTFDEHVVNKGKYLR
ncbi:MAG TPA: endolytic transglycosylase MltG [Candidatus Yonathbacteria bacterium]|nr:endolytic transglycosylase MltG [Candidatus Yonathbacteria bacterium]